jgi:Flp pilus assembly protein TadG
MMKRKILRVIPWRGSIGSLRGNIGPFLKRLAKDKKGGFMVLTAILMPVLAGFAGLGIDATMWMTHKRYTQSMADEASMAGAFLALANSGNTAVQTAATQEATRNGLNPGTGVGQDVIAINSPPLTGAHIGKAGFVEVTVTRNAPLYFSNILNINSVKVVSRAVAGGVNLGNSCILALNNTKDQAVYFSGSTVVTIGCGVTSNSSSSQSIYINGNAALTADPAQAYGDIYLGGSASLITNSPVEPYAQRLPDPYSTLTIPTTPAGCTFNSASIGNNAALTPGRYCGDLTLKGNVTMAPGTYIIDSGSIASNGNTNIVGTGVTIILTASNPANIGNIKFTGNVSSTLSAPTTGPYAGILFYQDPNALIGGSNSFLGNNSMVYTGAIYFPKQQVTFSGNGSVTSHCLQVVGDSVYFSGNSDIENTETTCAAAAVNPMQRTQVQLVE